MRKDLGARGSGSVVGGKRPWVAEGQQAEAATGEEAQGDEEMRD